MRRAMLAIGVMTGILVVSALLLDEGEVVTLLTEAEGRTYSTQLWIVEIDGRAFVRANRPNARWLVRLRGNPQVVLRRSESHDVPAELYRARVIEDEPLKARVDAEISGKYRLADRVWGRIANRRRSQVIELQPRSGATSSAKGNPVGKPGAGS